MSFTSWIGDLFSSKGGNDKAVPMTYDQAQAKSIQDSMIANRGHYAAGRYGSVDTQAPAYNGFLNPVGDAVGGATNWALSAINYPFERGLHGLSAGWNVGDVANAEGKSQWAPLYTPSLWADSWNHTNGEATTQNKDGTLNPGFGQSVWHAVHPLARYVPVIGSYAEALGSDQGNETGNVFGSTPDAVKNRKSMQDEQATWSGRLGAGAVDFIAGGKFDATRLLAKGAQATRLANTVTGVEDAEKVQKGTQDIISGAVEAQSRYDPRRLNPFAKTGLFSNTFAESSQRQYRLIAATDNKTAAEIPELQQVLVRTPNAAPILAMFDDASQIKDLDLQREIKAHILGAAAGVSQSADALIAHAPLLARAEQRIASAPEGRPAMDMIHEAAAQSEILAPKTPGFHQPTFEELSDPESIGMTDREAARKAAAQSLLDHIDSQASPWNQAELEAMDPELLNIHAKIESLGIVGDTQALEFAGSTTLDRLKSGIQGGIARNFYYQPNAGGATVRVLHFVAGQKFRGHIDIENVGLGSAELMSHMQQSKLFSGEEIQAVARNFLKTTSTQGRSNIADAVKEAMYTKIAAKYDDLTPEQIAEMVKRDHATTAAGRHYTTSETQAARENGADRITIKNPFGGDDVSVDTGLFNTHVRGKVFLPDAKEIERIVRAESGMTISRGAALHDQAARLNNGMSHTANIWRLAVLGRPGLLVRTQIDTQGRALATLGAAAYFGQAAQALGHTVAKMRGDDIMQTTALARDLDHADHLDRQADELEALLARHTDPELDDPVHVPTLDVRGESMRTGTDFGTHEADNWRYATPEAMTERVRLLRAAAEDARNTERFVHRYRLGTQNEHFQFGQGTATTRAYEDTQGEADMFQGGTLFRGGVSRQEALTHQVTDRSITAKPMDDPTGTKLVSRGLDAITGVRANRLYERSNDYITAKPDMAAWWHYWVRGTDPLRNSATGKRILRLADIGTPDMMRALRSDPQVRAEYREMHLQGEELDDWISRASDEVIALAPTKGIRQALLTKGHMTQEQVESLFAKVEKNDKGAYVKSDPEDARPEQMHVQGPRLSALSSVPKSERDDGLIKKLINTFGEKPELIWGRHPVYVNRYYGHFERQAGRWFAAHPDATEMTPAVQARMETIARHRAIQDVHQVMYNTSKYTGAMAALRWASPFMGAWQDALESWTRLFYDNPAVAGAFYRTFQAPNLAGMVVDQDGNVVPPGSHADQQFVVLPSSLDSKFANGTHILVRKSSANTMFQGPQWYTPGSSPLVQVPANEVIARMFPEFAAASNPITKTLFPFGTPKLGSGAKGVAEDLVSSFTPAYAKDLYGAFWGPDNVAAFQTAYNEAVIQARKDNKPPTTAKDWQAIFDKANTGARNAGIIKALSMGLLGMSGTATNVADFYRKQYNLYVSGAKVLPKGMSPSEAFVKAYPEAAGLSFGFRKSQTGIQAYIKNIDAEKQFSKEIADNPPYGWAYLGAQNVGGQFSQSAYNYQASHMIGNKTERYTQSKEEIAAHTQEEDGWAQYNSFMTGVNTRLKEWGVSSLRSSKAATLKDIRDKYVADLEKANPAWGKAFLIGGQDNAIPRFITYFARPAFDDPRLKNRSDIVALQQYLDYRDQALAVAKTWGYDSITGTHTASLADAVAEYGRGLAASDVGFEQIWNKVLAREVDDGKPDTTAKAAA